MDVVRHLEHVRRAGEHARHRHGLRRPHHPAADLRTVVSLLGSRRRCSAQTTA
jgi:hypothetical protein